MSKSLWKIYYKPFKSENKCTLSLVLFVFDYSVNLLRKFILNIKLQKFPELSFFLWYWEDRCDGEIHWKLNTTTLYLLTRNLS